MALDDENSKLAEGILSRKAMARGVVVLDQDLSGLESALREANILVVTPRSELNDGLTKQLLLSHRIVITTKPADFIQDAPVHEYGVVALDRLATVDTNPHFETNKTARLISSALSSLGLWIQGAKFHLELRDDGNHVLKELR
jgi:hypothetical protein